MPILNPKLYDELVAAYRNNPDKFAFFVGAGLSQPLFPSWKTLLERMVAVAQESPGFTSVEEILGYLKSGENFLEIAEECIQAIGESRYRDILEETFDIDITEALVPVAYKKLLALAPSTIITTNYDRIPEVAGRGEYRTYLNSTVPEALRAISDRKKVVVKIHGDVSDQSSIVLKSSDYESILHRQPAVRQFLSSIMSTKVFIFLGFSMSDPHFAAILDYLKTINNDIPIAHYIFLEEKSSFKVRAITGKFGAKVVNFESPDQSFIEIGQFLDDLSEGHSSNQVVPEAPLGILDYTDRIANCIERDQNESSYSVLVVGRSICVSVLPVGQTSTELQKEIIRFFKQFTRSSTELESIELGLYAATRPTVVVDQCQPHLMQISCDFQSAHQFSIGKIALQTFWNGLSFMSPTSLSNLFIQSSPTRFPLHLGLID